MKILMVCTNPVFRYGRNVTKWALYEMIELLSRHNDVIFLDSLSPKDKERLPNDGTDDGNTYYFRQWMLFGYYLAIFTDLNISFLRKLREVARKEKIDLIYVTYPYGIISASIACRGMPIIYGSHAVVSDGVGETLKTLERLSAIFKITIIKQIARLLLQGYISLVERLACKRAAHIRASGEADKQIYIGKYGISGDKITVIPPYISSARFKEALSKRERCKKTNGPVTVIFHGSYIHPPNRDAFELILSYVAPEVSKRNQNILFLLAGTGVPVYERENVKLLGFVEDIQTLLANTDIAIIPILKGEGPKTKIFDYMAAGLPIISTKKGMWDIEVKDGKHAIILDAVDQKFIDVILDLAANKEKREMLGANALELAQAEHTEERAQARMDEMLTKVMESRKSRIIHKNSGL